MCNGFNPLTGEQQSFYFPDDHPHYPGWFKGMECIIREHGLWPKGGLPVECSGSNHPTEQCSCCCHHLVYIQPDFMAQKPLLQEYIKSRSHLCNFYSKYHCKLNFIEQYWGTAKLYFHVAGHARPLRRCKGRCWGVLATSPLNRFDGVLFLFSLFFIPGPKPICRFANRSAHFISAYHKGLSGAQAA